MYMYQTLCLALYMSLCLYGTVGVMAYTFGCVISLAFPLKCNDTTQNAACK